MVGNTVYSEVNAFPLAQIKQVGFFLYMCGNKKNYFKI